MPPLVSQRSDFWGMSAEIPYWWHVTTQIWVVFLIGHAARTVSFNQSEAPPEPGSDMSSVWHFYIHFSDIFLGGNRLWTFFLYEPFKIHVVDSWWINTVWILKCVTEGTVEYTNLTVHKDHLKFIIVEGHFTILFIGCPYTRSNSCCDFSIFVSWSSIW